MHLQPAPQEQAHLQLQRRQQQEQPHHQLQRRQQQRQKCLLFLTRRQSGVIISDTALHRKIYFLVENLWNVFGNGTLMEVKMQICHFILLFC